MDSHFWIQLTVVRLPQIYVLLLTVEGGLLGDAAEPNPSPDGGPHLEDALPPAPEDAVTLEHGIRDALLPLRAELWSLGLGWELNSLSTLEWSSHKYNLDRITLPPGPIKQILDVGAKTKIHSFKMTEPSRRDVSLLTEESKPIFCICLPLPDWPLATPFIECIFCQKIHRPKYWPNQETRYLAWIWYDGEVKVELVKL